MMRSGILLLIVAAIAPAVIAAPISLFVSPDGSDENPGTEGAPFATLVKARDTVRDLTGRTDDSLELTSDWGGATIYLLGGTHFLSEPVRLDARDSGTAQFPVVYRAVEGHAATISGGIPIPRSAWEQRQTPLLETRLRPEIVNSVFRLNLKDVGIKDLGEMGGPSGFVHLVADGKRVIPALWPNQSWARIDGAADDLTFASDNERVSVWELSDSQWLHGFWGDDAIDEWASLASIDRSNNKLGLRVPLSNGRAVADQWFRAYNVLEELDAPGEWWYDSRRSQVLFVPEHIEDLDSTVLAAAYSVVEIEGADFTQFEGLNFEASAGTAIVVTNADGFRLSSSSIQNSGGWGIKVDGGFGAKVVGSRVESSADGGIWISGGEIDSLESSRHIVEQTVVSGFGRIKRSGNPGIRIEGVGTEVIACTIERGPLEGLAVTGNNHVIRQSTFRNLSTESPSAPAIRIEGGWIGRGNVIADCSFETINPIDAPTWLIEQRSNPAILLADGSSGVTIQGNRFDGMPFGVRVQGGRDNRIVENTFSETGIPVFLDVLPASQQTEDWLRAQLDAVPYQSGAWLTQYPQLADILGASPTSPSGNIISDNQVLDQAVLVDASAGARDFIQLDLLNKNALGEEVELSDLVDFASGAQPPAPQPPDLQPSDPQAVTPLPTSGLVYFVSPNGNDSNDGSEGKPFKTIKKARDSIRAATGRTSSKGSPSNGWAGATVVLRAGLHVQSDELVFDARDSGSADQPIEYRSYPGEQAIVTGARPVPDSAWERVTEADGFAWNKIDPEYRDKVYVVDVGAMGMDLGDVDGGWSASENMLMLIMGNSMRHMSRWPSGDERTGDGWVKLSSWDDNGSGQTATVYFSEHQPRNWGLDKQDILVQGMWAKSWCILWERPTSLSDNNGGTRLQFVRQGNYELGSGSASVTPFVALRNQLNVIGEGEYSWNKSRQRLYYRPMSGAGAPSGASLTHLRYLMRLGVEDSSSDAVSHVVFRDLVFEGSRKRTVRVYSSEDISFLNCDVRHSGGMGWEMKKVANITISGGSTHDISQKAGAFHGGDKSDLSNANILIEDHHVYDIAFNLHGNSTSAIQLSDASYRDSCGITLRRVKFERLRDQAIAVGGANITIEDCTFTDICMITGDAGGITTASAYDFALTNVNVRITGCEFRNVARHPYHQPSHGALYAIYADSQAYWTISDNFFDNCDHAINIAGGKHHNLVRNVFIGSPGHHKAPVVFGSRIGYTSAAAQLYSDLEKWPITSSPWSEMYPGLEDYKRGGPKEGLVNHHEDIVFEDNIGIDVEAIARIVSAAEYRESSGVMVGVDPSQLQYPIGAEVEPIDAGGTVELSSISR